MPKVAKPKLKIWQYYKLCENDTYSCTFCNSSYKKKKNATRMENHLKKCSKVLATIHKMINNETIYKRKLFIMKKQMSTLVVSMQIILVIITKFTSYNNI